MIFLISQFYFLIFFKKKMHSLAKEQAVLIRTHYFIFNILTFKREKKILCPTLS